MVRNTSTAEQIIMPGIIGAENGGELPWPERPEDVAKTVFEAGNSGEPPATRTRNRLIKSQLLCQLS